MDAAIVDRPSSGLCTTHPLNSSPLLASLSLEPLLLPHDSPAPRCEGSATNDTELSESHFAAFRDSHRAEVEGKWTIARATTEISVLRKAFPHVQTRQAIIAMAAWFHLLCTIDDEIESMKHDAARLALRESIRYMQYVSDGQEHTDERYSLRSKLPRRDSVTGQASPPVRSLTTMYSTNINTDNTSALAVQALTHAFVQHVATILAPHVMRSVKDNIIAVWEHMCLEIDQRARPEGPDLVAYLNIRTHTVGLGPFFAILQGYCYNGHEVQIANSHESDIKSLYASVSLAVGLQNDIIGLEKDIAIDEQLNMVRLLCKGDGRSLEEALATAVEMHNKAIMEAIRCRDSVYAESRLSALAESVLAFSRTHYAWATHSKRYST